MSKKFRIAEDLTTRSKIGTCSDVFVLWQGTGLPTATVVQPIQQEVRGIIDERQYPLYTEITSGLSSETDLNVLI